VLEGRFALDSFQIRPVTMQTRFASAVAAFLAAWQQTGALTVSTTAESQAASWLRAHSRGAPQADELAELRTENPEAYGIVKALLMKRSLGLLDPRHPTASFAAAKVPAAEVPGAEAFQKIAHDSGETSKVSDQVYPDAPMPTAHHDWLTWKPEQSALDDEAMVNNVLGSVAQVKGGSESKPAQSEESDLKWSSPSVNGPASIAPLSVAAAPPAAATSPPSQENSYLKGLDLGGATAASTPEQVQPSVAAAGSDSTAQSSGSFLTGFSWDDKEPAAKVQAAASSPATSGASAGKKPKNALLSWLR